MSGELLVVAASAPDFAGLRTHLGERLDGTIRDVPVRTKVLGIGLPIASAAVARGILAVQPCAVVLLGTCGIFPGRSAYRPLDVVVPPRSHLLDVAVLERRAELPTPMQTQADCDAMVSAGLQAAHPRAHSAPIASSLGRIVSDTLAAGLHAATGCDGENGELFGVATACTAAQVPFAAVLGVTNLIGSTAQKDWAQFQREAVVQAATTLANWLHVGAPGLPHGSPR
jgi:nucleoside phosphorylase